MTLFLLCRLANVIQETLITGEKLDNIPTAQDAKYAMYMATCCTAAAYGTYVVFGTHPKCKVEEEIIWDPRREVKVLVCLTWGFQLLVL